jgi:putative hydrolases of HD superfamily
MNEKDLDRLLDFMKEAIKIKEEMRTGWVLAGVKDPEHVGDHSFSTALLAYALAPAAHLNPDKCLRMALVHDAHEAITGDIPSRYGKATNEKRRMEYRDSMTMLSYLGSSNPGIRAVLIEFLKGRSKEAKFVHEVDKLDFIIQLTRSQKHMKAASVREFLFAGDVSIHTPELRYIYEKVRSQVYKEGTGRDDFMANQGAGGGCECGGGCRCGCTTGCRCKEGCFCGCTCGERRKERNGDFAY